MTYVGGPTGAFWLPVAEAADSQEAGVEGSTCFHGGSAVLRRYGRRPRYQSAYPSYRATAEAISRTLEPRAGYQVTKGRTSPERKVPRGRIVSRTALTGPLVRRVYFCDLGKDLP